MVQNTGGEAFENNSWKHVGTYILYSLSESYSLPPNQDFLAHGKM